MKPHAIEERVIKRASYQEIFEPPSPSATAELIFSHSAMISRNSQQACAKIFVITRAFAYILMTLEPIRLEKSHVTTELTVPLFRNGLKLNSHLLLKIVSWPRFLKKSTVLYVSKKT